MRINIHDFSGHPFQVQLSRELAARGHEVTHTYSDQYVTGRGKLDRQPADPDSLTITPIRVAVPFDKYHPSNRLKFEWAYARAWREFTESRAFDVVIMCNLPLLSQARAELTLSHRNVPWVFWHQDIYSHAISGEIRRKVPVGSAPLSRFVEHLERRQIRNADHVVAISDTFVAKYVEWGMPLSHVTVIPNWASLDDIRPGDRDNEWARENNLPGEGLRLMYSGTLGRKHNPLLLLALLDDLKARGVAASLTVCSEGVGADDLVSAAAGRPDVQVLGFQPAERFDQVLSSGDIVVALLEPDASNFSVPSKVLSYLSAGRVVVGLMPTDNPAVADIREAGGFVSSPDRSGARNLAGWIAETATVPRTLEVLGRQARELAEKRFDITAIGDRFESLLEKVVADTAR